MKNTLLFIPTMLLIASSVIGQSANNGSIIYEQTDKFEIKLEGEMAAMMKDFPKEKKSNKVLYFSPEVSLYENSKDSDVQNGVDFGAHEGMKIMIQEADNKVFIDLQKKEIIEKREFMTRVFQIKSAFPATTWKISGKQKMILGYPCMEATSTDTAGVITKVWFAPSIPISSGPGLYCNLPGMVLGVDKNNGDMTILAQSINLDPVAKEKFKKPKDGKKVSQEEFEKIVAEKMKEMGAGNGESGGSGESIVIEIHR